MRNRAINVVTFGKPDGYKDVHIGHLAGGALFADLYCRCMKHNYPEQRTYLVSGTDGYGMMTYVNCWRYIDRKPNNDELRNFVKCYHNRQKSTLNKYGIDMDYYGNDTDIENSKEIKKMCDFVFGLLLEKGVCELREEIEYIDDIYGVAVSERNVIKSNDTCNMVSKLSGGSISVRKGKNWFLNLEAAREIIENSKETYTDETVIAYIESVLKEKLSYFRITNNQPWAVPMGTNFSEKGEKKYQVWFASLLEPLVYANRICQNGHCEEIKDIHFEQFVAEDNLFYYAIIRPILWDVLDCRDVNLVYFKYRCFKDEKGNKIFFTGDSIAKRYGYDVIRLFFLLRGKNPTVYHFDTEEFTKVLRMIERIRINSRMPKRSSNVSNRNSKTKYKNIIHPYSKYICEHQFRKAADYFEYLIMNNKFECIDLDEIGCCLPMMRTS